MLTYGLSDNGFLSDFVVADAADLYHLPDRVSGGDAAFLEHVAMAVHTISQLGIEKGEHLVIVGANLLGMVLAQVAMYYQAVPILIDTQQDRLSRAESLGVYYTVNSVDTEPQKKIFSLTGGRMAEAVTYVTGSNMSLARSLDYAAKGGRVAIMGWADCGNDLDASFAGVFHRHLTVFGIGNGTGYFPSAINLIANRMVDVSKLISKEIGFDEVETYLKESAEQPNKYLKVIVKL